MRGKVLGFLLVVLAACGGSGGNSITPPPAKKPDPYLTVRVRDLMDTTTRVGRTQWHIYALLSGPYTALSGISHQGTISLSDIRLHHAALCIGVSADSVGQRLLVTFAIGDTTTEAGTPDAMADSIVGAWYAGSRTLPAGWKALFILPTDAWQSAQYVAGHGLTAQDPIKWGWDWTGSGTTTFTERTDTDPMCSAF